MKGNVPDLELHLFSFSGYPANGRGRTDESVYKACIQENIYVTTEDVFIAFEQRV